MEPTLAFIKELALHAGKILRNYVDKDLDIKHKSRTDLVTIADHASEKFLIDSIKNAFPLHAINAEESGELVGEKNHQWFIDPLDGTLNFAHGVPIYSVSIGYAYQGKMTLGVIYDPSLDEIFCAERGQGVTMNGESIHVADHQDLIDCMLYTSFPHDQWGSLQDNTDNFFRFCQVSQTVRRLGSAALAIAYIAAGRLDGIWQTEIYQWDVAAGALMIEEAGGIVTDIYGRSDYLRKPVSFLAANPIIHSAMLDVLEEVRSNRKSK